MRNKSGIIYRIVILIGFILPVIPIALLILFFYLPRDYEPYVLNLAGKWNVQYSNMTRTIELPSVFSKYGIKSFDVVLIKSIVLKENMQDADLFFMISGTIFQTGKIYINDFLVGEIGEYQKHRKFGMTVGIDGFPVRKDILKKTTNDVKIYLQTEDLPSFGIPDPRFYIGVNRYLRSYYEQNAFINNFFQYGVIFFSLLILLVLFILAISEWNSGNHYKYISIGMYVFGSLVYNVFFSGAFVSYYMSQLWIGTWMNVGIAILGMANMEFIQYYFTGKINRIGKINRFICVAVMILFLVFTFNNDLENMVYFLYIPYLMASLLYGLFITIRSILKNKTRYGVVVAFSVYLTLVTGTADILSNIGLILFPMMFGITLSCLCIVATIVVIADFISMGEKNIKLSKFLRKSNDSLRKMIRRVRETKMMEFDMSMASKIQAALLPQKFPDNENVSISGGSIPAKLVGGDYFDVIPISDSLFLCAIADVMGKGMSASLVMVKVQTLLRALSGEEMGLVEMAERINGIISTEFHGERFVTLSLLKLDSKEKKAEYALFGHEPIMVYRKNGQCIELYKNENMPLGIEDKLVSTGSRTIDLKPGDRIILFTDGVTEAQKEGEEFFGMERFKSIVMETAKEDMRSFFSHVIGQVTRFRGTAEQSDDITLLIIEVK